MSWKKNFFVGNKNQKPKNWLFGLFADVFRLCGKSAETC